jgi:hypothetical protein
MPTVFLSSYFHFFIKEKKEGVVPCLKFIICEMLENHQESILDLRSSCRDIGCLQIMDYPTKTAVKKFKLKPTETVLQVFDSY